MSVFRTRTTKRTKGGAKKTYVSKTWRARAKDPITGERVERSGFRTRTEGEAWKYATERGEGRALTPGAVVPLIDEFRAHLRDKGTSPAQVDLTVARVGKVLALGEIVTTADLTEDGIRRALARAYEAINADQTKKHHRAALRQFCRHLTRKRILAGNPMADVGAPRVRRIVHERRAFAAGEIARLHAATRPRPDFRGLSGEQRDLVYTIGLAAGLRASEIAALRPAHLDLGRERPHVHLPGTETKNGEPARVPLPAHLAACLAAYVTRVGPEERLFPGNWAKHKEAGVMLRRDLEAAGVPYKTREGFGDFHALRHTFITNLIRAGVPPKIVQTLARHSTITLTLDRYTAVEQSELFDAINRPEFVQSLDAPPSSAGTNGPESATRPGKVGNGDETGRTTQGHDPSASCVIRHEQASGGGGIRTHGTLAGTPVFETGPFDHSGTPPGVFPFGRSSVQEEFGEQGRAVSGEDTRGLLDSVVQTRVIGQSVEAPAGTGFRVGRPINQSSHATQADRPGAHRARFEGRVERAAVEPPASQRSAGEGQCQPFRVGRGVVERLPEVVSLRDDPTLENHQGTDRDFADRRRLSSQFQRSTHHLKVLRVHIARGAGGREHGRSGHDAKRRRTEETR